MNQVRNSYKLNAKQIHLLLLMYKFRFVTSILLADYRQTSNKSAINKSLRVLIKKGYIARRYDKSYKLLGKPASYYLAKEGFRYLRSNFNVDKRAIHAMYKNPSASETFAQHCLDVFRAYLSLKASYPDTFKNYTRPEVLEYDYMPSPTPDLYLGRKDIVAGSTNEYLLDILTDIQFFIIKKRINLYIKHFEEGDWPEQSYPTVLIVCDDSKIQNKLSRYVQKQLDDNYIDEQELIFMTTTKKALFDSNNQGGVIWREVFEPNEVVKSL